MLLTEVMNGESRTPQPVPAKPGSALRISEGPQAVVAGDSHLGREICALLSQRNISHVHLPLHHERQQARAFFAVSDDDRLNIDLALAAVKCNEAVPVVLSLSI